VPNTHPVKERLYIGFLGGVGHDRGCLSTPRLNLLNNLLQALCCSASDEHVEALACEACAYGCTQAAFWADADN